MNTTNDNPERLSPAAGSGRTCKTCGSSLDAAGNCEALVAHCLRQGEPTAEDVDTYINGTAKTHPFVEAHINGDD
jgi:hypothetical protein